MKFQLVTILKLLKNDFNKINSILSSLVSEVEKELSRIWPTLKKIIHFTNKVDDFFINFSMEIARDGAWDFATKLHQLLPQEIEKTINDRDRKIFEKALIITNQGLVLKILFGIIRLGEKGTVGNKINILNS